MGSEDTERIEETTDPAGSGKRRRRRRRRNRRAQNRDGAEATGRRGGSGNRRGREWRGRDSSGPSIHLPSSGRVPYQRQAIHPHRGKVANAGARRRRVTSRLENAHAARCNARDDVLLDHP